MEQPTLINLMTLASSLGGIIQSDFISDFKACLAVPIYLSLEKKGNVLFAFLSHFAFEDSSGPG